VLEKRSYPCMLVVVILVVYDAMSRIDHGSMQDQINK
jgi:fumarate reductase subunit D